MPPDAPSRVRTRGKLPVEFRDLLYSLLAHASREESRTEVLGRMCASLLRFSGCDAVTIRLDGEGGRTRCRACVGREGRGGAERPVRPVCEEGAGDSFADPLPPAVVEAILDRRIAAPAASSTRGGSFWIGDTARPIMIRDRDAHARPGRTVVIGGDFLSVAMVPIAVSDRCRGALFLADRRRDFFSSEDILVYEAVAQTLGVALAHQGAQWALRERVKELTCLYGIERVAGRPGMQPEPFLTEIVRLLPQGWQYPDVCEASVTLDGRAFSTAGFRPGPHRQSADISINGVRRGDVQVVYLEERPAAAEGPFLREERSLIDQVASQVGFAVEHWEIEAEAARLQEQLRHAERLATVGQLSAGVAHELNEPLAAILGFAELVKQAPGVPHQASQDIDRIVRASLHAREIIRKLMIFTRQMPTRKAACDLNQIATDGLYLLESRCAKNAIEVARDLEEGLPAVLADPSQMHQVLVNLVVNAIQAMPDGGTLTIATRSRAGRVCLSVTDTGVGMTADVQRQLFVPFFSTKEVGQGTGLGLPVVHGIVTAHGGTIAVKSQAGRGSSFEISIPVHVGPTEETT